MVGPILLLVNDPQRADRIRAALDDCAAEISSASSGHEIASSIPLAPRGRGQGEGAAQAVRLVISDHARRDELVEQHGAVGVIAVANGEGDVLLDNDFTPRELRLACELLSEIVELRNANSATSIRQREWQQLALSDPLTGLANRRAWEEELQCRMNDARAIQTCVALLDLDHFKRINDEHGHAAGDEVLRATANALRKNVRGNDFVARLGGDEFALLLDSLDSADAEPVLERIRASVCRELANFGPRAVTVSVGLATSDPSSHSDAAKFYSSASAALRLAKRTGRDRTIRAAI